MQWGAMGCNECNERNKTLDPPTHSYILLGKGFTIFALVSAWR
jgi:hypothetical protein